MANHNLRAFLIYNQKGFLIGGPIIRTAMPKDTRRYVEIPYNYCCDGIPLPTPITGPRQLKAFVKYTPNGKVVSGFLKKGYTRPRDLNENFVEVPINICCYFTTTTTTTSTSTSSTTTTTTTVATTTTTSTSTTTTTTV